jgi:AcrR family transcriptional regulator
MSGRTRTRLSGDQRRVRLVSAATTEFGAHGYRGGSLREIAAAAGITTPVIYDHFDSKAELYSAVAWELADDLLAHWSGATLGSAEDTLRATITAIFSWAEANPSGWRILFADVPSDPVIAAAMTSIQGRAAKAVAAAIAQFSPLDQFETLSDAAASAAFAEMSMSAVNGLVAWWWNNPDVPRATVATLAGDLLWHGLDGISGTQPQEEKPK